MLKNLVSKHGFKILIMIGIIVRITVFYVSPPNNAYDDHLEVISMYIKNQERPLPFSCWECYQPPLYYSVGAVLYDISSAVGLSNQSCWKVVQAINPILSIVVLIIFYKILLFFNIENKKRLLYLSFIIILPRDIFTSVMIGNDYLLVFATIGSLFYYLKIIDSIRGNKKTNNFNLIYLTIFVIIGGLTKQHGLLLLVFPLSIFLYRLITSKQQFKTLFFVIISVTILILEEIWKYSKTGEFLVSNQHFFDYAVNQFPGSLDKIEFLTFRFFSLLKEPFFTENTAVSLPTELYARTFFDYEWRFLSPRIPLANAVGRLGYLLGLVWFVYFIISTAKKIKVRTTDSRTISYEKLLNIVPTFVGFLFLLVPIIQTVRYPYFSSMKAMFMLPGIIILLLMHANFVQKTKINYCFLFSMITLNIFYVFLLIISILFFLKISLNHLHGPLWPIPF